MTERSALRKFQMDKELVLTLIREEFSNKEIRDISHNEEIRCLELTSGLKLQIEGVREGRGIESHGTRVKVYESGQLKDTIWLSLLIDYGLVPRSQRANPSSLQC